MKWEEIHAIEQKDPLWHHVVYLLETINKIKPDATALAVIWLIQGSLFLSQNIQKEENTFQQQNIFAHSSDFFVQQISAVSGDGYIQFLTYYQTRRKDFLSLYYNDATVANMTSRLYKIRDIIEHLNHETKLRSRYQDMDDFAGFLKTYIAIKRSSHTHALLIKTFGFAMRYITNEFVLFPCGQAMIIDHTIHNARELIHPGKHSRRDIHTYFQKKEKLTGISSIHWHSIVSAKTEYSKNNLI